MPTGQHSPRISVDRARCAGHGVCVLHAPGTFDLDEEDISVVLDQADADAESVRRAQENCPEHAITVEENS